MRSHAALAWASLMAACHGGAPAGPAPVGTAGARPPATGSTAQPVGAATASSAAPLTSVATTSEGEPMDAWSRDDGRPLPEVVWHRAPRGADEPALPKPCASLERRYGRKQRDVIDFGCAVSPTGEAWAAVARLKLPPDSKTQIAKGSWQVIVDQGGKVKPGRTFEFELFASHAGGACQTDPAPCLEYAHYAGLLWPRGFRFVEIDGTAPAEAFAVGAEEINTDRAPEMSLTLWRLGVNEPELHPPSDAAAILGIADCSRDSRLEIAVNPYRTAGDKFVLRFGAHARASSEAWSLLLTLGPRGWSNDGPLSRSYARRLCPHPPDNPFATTPNVWPQALHCAKLACAPEATLAQQLAAACSAASTPEVTAACEANRAGLDRMIRASIPCLLPHTGSDPLPPGCFDQAMAEGSGGP